MSDLLEQSLASTNHLQYGSGTNNEASRELLQSLLGPGNEAVELDLWAVDRLARVIVDIARSKESNIQFDGFDKLGGK